MKFNFGDGPRLNARSPVIDPANADLLRLLVAWRNWGPRAAQSVTDATKEDLAEAARILAMQAAHYARKYGETPLPDLQHLLHGSLECAEGIALMRDGTEALVGVLAMVTRTVPIKLWMGSTYFLTKTLDRVSTEMGLHVLAYNLKRIMKILGNKGLIEAIRA